MLRATIIGITVSCLSLTMVLEANAKPPPPEVLNWPVMSGGVGDAPSVQQGVCTARTNYTKWSGTAVSFVSDTTCPVSVSVLAVTTRLYDRFQGQWELLAEIPQWCLGFSYCSATGFESDLWAGAYLVTGTHYCAQCVPTTVNTSRSFTLP